jgi:hypothetical protein
MVTPVLNPITLDWIAPLTPDLQISLLTILMAGEFAVGGVLLTTVELTVFVSALI